MKLKGMSGEWAFKALIKYSDSSGGWILSTHYFFTKQEVLQTGWKEIIWPVEVQDGQIVYIPTQEELA